MSLVNPDQIEARLDQNNNNLRPPASQNVSFTQDFKYLTINGYGDIALHKTIPYNKASTTASKQWFSEEEYVLQHGINYPLIYENNDLVSLVRAGNTVWHEGYLNLYDGSIQWLEQ